MGKCGDGESRGRVESWKTNFAGEQDHCKPIPNFDVRESSKLDFWLVFVGGPGGFEAVDIFSWTCAHFGVSFGINDSVNSEFSIQIDPGKGNYLLFTYCFFTSMMLWFRSEIYTPRHTFFLSRLCGALTQLGWQVHIAHVCALPRLSSLPKGNYPEKVCKGDVASTDDAETTCNPNWWYHWVALNLTTVNRWTYLSNAGVGVIQVGIPVERLKDNLHSWLNSFVLQHRFGQHPTTSK